MKLNEAILIESFGDLKRILAQAFVDMAGDTEITGRNLSSFKESHPRAYGAYNSIIRMYNDMRQQGINLPIIKKNSSDGIFDLMKWVSKHPSIRNHRAFGSLADTGNWIKMIRTGDMGMVFTVMESALNEIKTHELDPSRQKPSIETIKKTSKYEVYKLNNYMAARKVCNTFKTNFCIGADPGWFDRYGKDKGRETYAITLPNRTVVIVHSGPDGFLITSHDNESDINESLRGRGRSARGIIDDFKEAGLSQEDTYNALASTISSAYRSKIKSIIMAGWEKPDDLIYERGGLQVEQLTDDIFVFSSNRSVNVIYAMLVGSSTIIVDHTGNFADNASRETPDEFKETLDEIGFDGRSMTGAFASMYQRGGEAKRFASAVMMY